MALNYDPSKDPNAFYCEGPSLTEPEHAPSCDINIMIMNAARGAEIRGNPAPPVYGYDDTNMDAVQLRIRKQQLEDDLTESAKNTELSEEEIKYVPESIQKKFGFKTKKKNNELNDETKTSPPTESKNEKQTLSTTEKKEPSGDLK